MRLLIDIPDKDYEFIKNAQILGSRRNCKTIEYNMITAIKQGIPYEQRDCKDCKYRNDFSKAGCDRCTSCSVMILTKFEPKGANNG